jgi:hypothetical protein
VGMVYRSFPRFQALEANENPTLFLHDPAEKETKTLILTRSQLCSNPSSPEFPHLGRRKILLVTLRSMCGQQKLTPQNWQGGRRANQIASCDCPPHSCMQCQRIVVRVLGTRNQCTAPLTVVYTCSSSTGLVTSTPYLNLNSETTRSATDRFESRFVSRLILHACDFIFFSIF